MRLSSLLFFHPKLFKSDSPLHSPWDFSHLCRSQRNKVYLWVSFSILGQLLEPSVCKFLTEESKPHLQLRDCGCCHLFGKRIVVRLLFRSSGRERGKTLDRHLSSSSTSSPIQTPSDSLKLSSSTRIPTQAKSKYIYTLFILWHIFSTSTALLL